jgi:hypothetical protein
MDEVKPVSVIVRLLTEELVSEVTAIECPQCYAFVRNERMNDHLRSHSDS